MNALVQGAAVGAVGLAPLTAGGIWAALRRPSDKTRTIIQHLAAGAVFAGLGADVLQRLLRSSH